MEPTFLSELERTFQVKGSRAAVQQLQERLRAEKDYHNLFYALLMEKRCELGVNPVPTGAASEIPEKHHPAYEEGIRQAGRQVGELYLKEGDIAQAWAYFRMLNEPAAVRQALEAREPAEGEDLHPLVQIAFYEGVHPRKGFDWILERYGICNAITTLSSQELPFPPEDKQYCLGRLVRALYHELRERLIAEITRRGEPMPPEADLPRDTRGVVHRLIADRPWLFEEDFYHIDTSHLSSVVQMSVHLPPGLELSLARELCEYGKHLSGRFLPPGDPPFGNYYQAHDKYLGILTGDAVEEGLAYFRAEAEAADPNEIGTYPAEVLVNLLLRLDRQREALEVAKKYLAAVDNRRLTCPSLAELCQKVGDYRALAEAAREQGDAVHFLAGLLGSK